MLKSSIVLLVLAAFCAPAAAEFKSVDLGKNIRAMAINPDTGEVAIIFADQHDLDVFPHLSDKATTDGDRRRPLGFTVEQVVYKRVRGHSYWVVLRANTHTLIVLDTATLATLHEFVLPAFAQSLGAVENRDVPFVYYSVGERIGRLDLSRMLDEGLMSPPGLAMAIHGHPAWLPGGQQSFSMICSSADGQFLFARESGRTLTWVIETAAKLDDFQPQAIVNLGGANTMHAEPFSHRIVLDGAAVRRPRTPRWLAAPDILLTHSCSMTRRPLLFDLRDDLLRVYSSNTDKELASRSLDVAPADDIKRPPSAVSFARPEDLPILCDEKNERLLICRGRQILVAPIADLDLPKEPNLALAVLGPPVVFTGRQVVFTLTRQCPGASISLAKAPAGMTLGGDALHWTAGNADVGTIEVDLRITAGELERSVSFDFRVARPEVELGVTGRPRGPKRQNQRIMVVSASTKTPPASKTWVVYQTPIVFISKEADVCSPKQRRNSRSRPQ